MGAHVCICPPFSQQYDLALPVLPFPIKGHIMKGFCENLVDIVPIFNAKYSVLFNDELVTIICPAGTHVLTTGWREETGNKLWRISLLPDAEDVTPHKDTTGVTTTSLVTFSVHDLPSVETLVRHSHAAAGYPVRDAWLKAIKAGN